METIETTPSPSRNDVPSQFLSLDEEGYFHSDGVRWTDPEVGQKLFASIDFDKQGRLTASLEGKPVLIEAFDEPLVALNIEKGSSEKSWTIEMPYGYRESFDLTHLTVDEWDRFHGRTTRGIPFVMSRGAQSLFFNLVDEFDDDAITVNSKRTKIPPWLVDNVEVSQEKWWTSVYQSSEPKWDLQQPSPVLVNFLPRLKLPKARVIVLGAGTGHDAAWLASQGHLVTAVDFSEEAVARTEDRYGGEKNLKVVHADLFHLPASMNGNYDVVFEHTCYCAITPARRNELTRVWRRLLAENGHLLGIFLTMNRPKGPPYGSSEWEVRSRLKKSSFRPLFWSRSRDSLASRLGQEFLVYAQKFDSLNK